MKPRILLLGNTGQLGWELNRTLMCLGEVRAFDYPDIDFTKAEQLRKFVLDHNPDVIYNATAYTAVDKAEQEEETANLINSTGPAVLAETARKLKAVLIHYSTDYVFDGSKGSAYVESDEPNPLNVYGKSKYDGETAIQQIGGNHLIFRTSWVYSTRKPCFVSKVLKWARNNPQMRIVDDQISNPTWARLLAEITTLILNTENVNYKDWLQERSGLYHLAGDGSTSRYDWAKEILRLDPKHEEQTVKEIRPAKSSDFKIAALRPLNSELNCDHFKGTFRLSLPDWRTGLALAMKRS